MNKRIYFSGAHSSGKSTLSRYVSEQYNLPMISECARMVLSEQELQIDSLRTDLKITDSYQEAVFDRQLLEEKKRESYVSDRCLIDILAYSAEYSRILPKLMKRPELRSYIDSLKLTGVSIFFVKPSRATLHADGVRENLNWDHVISIDAQIKLLLEMFEVKYYQINTDNMQERVRIIDSVLSFH